MSKNRIFAFTSLLTAIAFAGAAQAQYLLSPSFSGPANNGGQLQIGTGLPLPVGGQGIFLGGMTPMNAGPANFPQLLVNTGAAGLAGSIMQGLSTAKGGKITFPANVLTNLVGPMTPRPPIAVYPTNPTVFQVRTSISYKWPSAAAVFSLGGAPGIACPPPCPLPPAVSFSPAATYSITYSKSTKAFGGAAQFAIAAGPLAGTFVLPPNGAKQPPIATVWINSGKKAPASATIALLAGASNYNGLAAAGASVAAAAATTMWGPGGLAKSLMVSFMAPNIGKILASMPVVPAPVPSNMVIFTKGYPWTTGLITVAAPGTPMGNPAETFFLSGSDMRVAGVGNLSLVSGALSQRVLSGPNANRGWLHLTIPEPTVALGSVGALAMLGLCHGLVRRRTR